MPQDLIDLEFQIRRFFRRYRSLIILLIVVLVVLLWPARTLLYSVEPDSEGVVLRLGRYARTTDPGLHTKLPWPIESVYKVPVQRIQSLEFGFRTIEAGRVTRYAPQGEEQQVVALMLTGDLNLAHVEWVVQYRIADAQHYLFKIGGSASPALNADDLIQDASESVMRKLVGDASVDEVITVGRDQIANDARDEIQTMLDRFEAGIQVVTVKLQSATPPEPVKDAFDEVNRARQKKERVVNEARGERNRLIPAARGQRDRTISEAEGYRERVVREMTGRANAFLAQLAEFEKAPEVTRTRLYLEAMEDILSHVERKIVIDESVRGVLPLLDLSGPAGAKGGGQ
jgi:membrane protease subunit HflK